MALYCPGCGSPLRTLRRKNVEIDVCRKCRGTWFDRDELRPVLVALASDRDVKDDDFRDGPREVLPQYSIKQTGRRCPRDNFVLQTFNYGYDSNVLLDRCPQCMGVFAGRSELRRLARYIKGNPEQRAIGRLLAETTGSQGADIPLDSVDSWEEAVGLGATYALGVSPLTFIALGDDQPRKSFPFVTVALIAANAAIFVLTLCRVLDWTMLAMVPKAIRDGQHVHGLFTSMFVHAGVMHLVFNMLWLWIFGDNVEDRLGRLWFLAFYLFCGLVASLTQAVSDVNSELPVVGASGAVAGVLGAYLLFFPRSRVRVLFFARVSEISAVWFIMAWFIVQLACAMFLRGGPDSAWYAGVAWYAHIGGFVVGALLAVGVKQLEMARD